MTASKLVVSEVFGPTFQGEGPSLGRRCSFLRLGGCNQACVWCDTPYTWDWSGRNGRRYDRAIELSSWTSEDLWSDLLGRGADLLVVSGGEPLLQQQALIPLLERCVDQGWQVEIETAATVAPDSAVTDLVTRFNASPKLKSSGNAIGRRYRPEAIDALASSNRVAWKFVLESAEELEEIDALVTRHHLRPIYVMPEGVTTAQMIARGRALAGPVLERGWNMTTRLHVLLYENRRGV